MREEEAAQRQVCKDLKWQEQEKAASASNPVLRDLPSCHSQRPKANGVRSREAPVSEGKKWKQGRGWRHRSGGASTPKAASDGIR